MYVSIRIRFKEACDLVVDQKAHYYNNASDHEYVCFRLATAHNPAIRRFFLNPIENSPTLVGMLIPLAFVIGGCDNCHTDNTPNSPVYPA